MSISIIFREWKEKRKQTEMNNRSEREQANIVFLKGYLRMTVKTLPGSEHTANLRKIILSMLERRKSNVDIRTAS